MVRTLLFIAIAKLCIIRKTLKGRKQTKMEGGQSGTYLRLTRASSGPRLSVAKTYRQSRLVGSELLRATYNGDVNR